ncbi:probable G-protein coupled receptor 179 [Orycteropus afer afer]|uniref:Probable G-protein coupled receptor 179 n=1 Tax=Orycteropus afer afer TaxID=1230840 RepID=A0A8B6ZWX8_ORYAF|nr:probable G-protein coupled receptor 179 [Orycteropus afer afer]
MSWRETRGKARLGGVEAGSSPRGQPLPSPEPSNPPGSQGPRVSESCLRIGTKTGVMPPPVWGLLVCCFLCGWALGGPRPIRSLPPLSSQAQPGSVSMWVLPEGAEAALAFLYSGDAQQLSGANCSERYEAHGAGARTGLPLVLQRAAGTVAQAANFLNMLLQANDIRESSVEEDVEWYQALVRSVAEGDPRAYRALLTFSPSPGANHLQLALQATRMQEETLLQDLSGSRMQGESQAGDLDTRDLQKRVLTNDLGSLGSPKWPQGDGYVGDMQHVRLSPPFLECQQGRLRPGWLITLSATFYGLKPDLSPEVRGQVQMDVDLQSVDINQCASGPGWYSNTHLCDLNSTQCVPLESQGFVLGRYLCRCRPGFYGASHSGGLEESTSQPTGQFGSLQGGSGRLLQCQPCPEGCTSCIDATPCLVEEALALRATVMVGQTCCMLVVFLSMLVSYRCRQSKRIRASGVILLETILFGSLLLYFPVFILYFKPSVFRCIALRWVRLLGFVMVYGTIILKLYRVLQLFLSRTAQRGPHLSSGRLLRRLGLFLLLVLGFLVVWTAGVLEQGIQHTPLVTQGHTPTGRHFYLCHHDRWDYLMVVAEMLLLCWGSFLCYATRAVPSAFHEPRYMGIALHNELLLSAAFHAARFVLVPSLHPDWTLLLFFFHTHSTVTATLALIFIPKFRKPGAPSREEIVEEVYEDELDLQRSGSYLDSSTASAWSERSLDPGDIRDELKKLYAQLEVHKTKEMAANNPHLPKKRGSSRQGLGRSFMRYLAEFPEALVRQHSRDSGSVGRSSLPGSSRRRLLSSSLQEPEGPPALRKSRSSYDHCREQEPPLLDSLLKRKLAKKASRGESRDSVEGPPVLGFRSASAHNLTVGERLPRARPASLHKSLSVAAGSREKALLLASQAYLEETYRQAKEREERKKAEAAVVSPVRRPSARKLERARGSPLSAPPSPAKSSSLDSSHASKQLHEEAGKRLPHPPIRHQVSTPILTLSGAYLGEPRLLSPTCILAPALMPAPAVAPAPALAPAPASSQSPSLLTFICPWENAELPVRKENAAQEGPSGPERGNHSPAPAQTRIWRTLSVAVEKRGTGENEMDTEDGDLQGEAEGKDEDRPKIFPKSHSLKAPSQQGSMRSLGLAIKALTRSRSTYREKESGEESTERGEKSRVSGESKEAAPRSPRVGRPKAVSKQAALAPCDDEESLQNQQNAHTSRMLQVCHQEGSREQDRGRRASQGLVEGKAEKAGKMGPATLRQGRQGTDGDKNAERAKEVAGGWQERPKACLQPLGSGAHRVAEVCPWEVPKSEMWPLDSSNKAEICPWEVSEGTLERGALRQDLEDRPQEEMGKAPEKLAPKDVVATARKKPEKLVRGQKAVCPWEGTDPGGLSPPSAPQNTDRSKGRSEAVGSGEAREVAMCRWEATGPEACKADMAKAEVCPWEASGGGENGKPSQKVAKELPQEKLKTPKKGNFWKEQKLGGDWESLCPWESTDFRGPSAVSTQASGIPECSGSLGSGITEVCPWEAGDVPAPKKAEICSWELGAERVGKETASQGTGGESLQEKEKASSKGSSGEMEEQAVKTVQKVSQLREAVCPWESTASEHSSPYVDNALSKSGGQPPNKDGSRVTQVCPREDSKPQVREATPAEAETYPWEVNERTKGDWTSGQAPKGSESQKDQEKMSGQPGITEADATAWEEPEGQIPKQEAVCPWEKVDPSSLPRQPGSQDTDKPKTSFQMSGSVGSKTAEICPWDAEETLITEKARICPWEVSAGAVQERPLGVEAIRKFPNDKGKASGECGLEAAVAAPQKPERPAQEREAPCPWEGLDPGGSSQHARVLNTDAVKAGPQDLDSVGCRPAEVCPWEVEEVPTTEKAEVCPWEVNEGVTEKGLEQEMGSESAGQKKALEKGRLISLGEDISKWEAKLSQEQESVCPWENTDLTEPSAQAPEVSGLSSSLSSQVAEGHSLGVSDEVAEKGAPRQDAKRGSHPEHMLSQEKAAGSKAEFTIEDGENTNKEQQSVCPWESLAPGGFSSHPDTQRTDQLKTSSQGQVSVGGRVAEVCPWDVPHSDAYTPDGPTQDEICPWERSEQIPQKRVLRQDGKGESQEQKVKAPGKSEPKDVAIQKLEKADRKQEAVCPWESQDCGSPSPQPAPKASNRSKGSSEAAGGVGARVADVCPWEVEESPSVKKAEICPWEMSTGAAEKEGLEQKVDRDSQGQGEMFPPKAGSGGTEEHFSKAAAKLSREQETVCPWEGSPSGLLFLQPDALDTDQAKVSPHKASSLGTRIAELCRWEVTDPEGNKIKGTMADICPWEGIGAPSEESGLLAVTATQTEMFIPTAYEKPPCLSVQRPLESLLPESKSPRPEVSKPDSTLSLEGARELQRASALGLGSSLAPEPSLQEAKAPKFSSSTEDKEAVISEMQNKEFALPNVYPWDWE